MDVKVGDVVHVRAVVIATDASHPDTVRIKCVGLTFYANQDDIIHVEPRALQVGDKVKWETMRPEMASPGEVVAIDRKIAWIRGNDGSDSFRYVSDLVRA